jgi:hypothetical protein
VGFLADDIVFEANFFEACVVAVVSMGMVLFRMVLERKKKSV